MHFSLIHNVMFKEIIQSFTSLSKVQTKLSTSCLLKYSCVRFLPRVFWWAAEANATFILLDRLLQQLSAKVDELSDWLQKLMQAATMRDNGASYRPRSQCFEGSPPGGLQTFHVIFIFSSRCAVSSFCSFTYSSAHICLNLQKLRPMNVCTLNDNFKWIISVFIFWVHALHLSSVEDGCM